MQQLFHKNEAVTSMQQPRLKQQAGYLVVTTCLHDNGEYKLDWSGIFFCGILLCCGVETSKLPTDL